ncbi:TetR/AcrR family transcriptional regulator [Streptomyces hesseae]|uniref:TetR/AcrR family transcriptional regulator n=1 Tax=Streptomyces hesseae TaxID=3075519 RepID=A0ABU2STV6_9ACTN|nr:TetR/AcrR family transcriptional regulator [Streptomyces sp. DSM 40473]MDT0452439.1 TetR/AcrR family transcriptional regulator [Streptomyces sp. DSM 40473]
MARPRKFDEEGAVDAALEAFWTAGYEATSTQDLCEATGLGRSSVYNTFHSKRDLFRRALALYMRRRSDQLAALLDEDVPAREKVRALLDSVIAEETGADADGRGCLYVNTAVELASRDPEVAAELERDYARRHDALTAALEAGQRAGGIDRAKDASALAHFVTATVGGIRVAARAGAGETALRAIARTALDAI